MSALTKGWVNLSIRSVSVVASCVLGFKKPKPKQSHEPITDPSDITVVFSFPAQLIPLLVQSLSCDEQSLKLFSLQTIYSLVLEVSSRGNEGKNWIGDCFQLMIKVTLQNYTAVYYFFCSYLSKQWIMALHFCPQSHMSLIVDGYL